MNELHIAFATDKAYLKQTCVAVESVLLASAGQDSKYYIYVLMPSDDEEGAEACFAKIRQKYNDCMIQTIGVTADLQNASIVMRHITLPTYYRLLLPDLIQQDKCLYLDSDIIVCRDLSELYDSDIEGYCLGGVYAPAYMADQGHSSEIGIPRMDQYINAGVLLCNLEQMRKENFTQRCLELIEKPFPAQDQDIINKIGYGKIKLLPFKFNLQAFRLNLGNQLLGEMFSEDELNEAVKEPVIIHYLTEKKPWEWFDVNYADKWWEICSQNQFFDDFMKEYQLSFYYYGVITHKKLWNFAVYTDEWYRELKRYPEIYLYGAGKVGERTMKRIQEAGITIKAVLVSKLDEKEKNTICGVAVKEFSNTIQDSAVILVATSRQYQVQIRRMLFKMGKFMVISMP